MERRMAGCLTEWTVRPSIFRLNGWRAGWVMEGTENVAQDLIGRSLMNEKLLSWIIEGIIVQALKQKEIFRLKQKDISHRM